MGQRGDVTQVIADGTGSGFCCERVLCGAQSNGGFAVMMG